MDTLELLEKAIDDLAWKRAMEKINSKRNIKTWKKLDKKLGEVLDKERDKIIQCIIHGNK